MITLVLLLWTKNNSSVFYLLSQATYSGSKTQSVAKEMHQLFWKSSSFRNRLLPWSLETMVFGCFGHIIQHIVNAGLNTLGIQTSGPWALKEATIENFLGIKILPTNQRRKKNKMKNKRVKMMKMTWQIWHKRWQTKKIGSVPIKERKSLKLWRGNLTLSSCCRASTTPCLFPNQPSRKWKRWKYYKQASQAKNDTPDSQWVLWDSQSLIFDLETPL